MGQAGHLGGLSFGSVPDHTRRPGLEYGGRAVSAAQQAAAQKVKVATQRGRQWSTLYASTRGRAKQRYESCSRNASGQSDSSQESQSGKTTEKHLSGHSDSSREKGRSNSGSRTRVDRPTATMATSRVITPPQAGPDTRTHSSQTSGRGPGGHKSNKPTKATAPAEPAPWDHLTVGAGVVPEGAKRIMREETGQVLFEGTAAVSLIHYEAAVVAVHKGEVEPQLWMIDDIE